MTLLRTCCFNRFRSFVLYTILVNKYMFYYYVIFECVNIMTNGFICCMWKCNFNEKCWEHRLYVYLTATKITYISHKIIFQDLTSITIFYCCLYSHICSSCEASFFYSRWFCLHVLRVCLSYKVFFLWLRLTILYIKIVLVFI